MTPDLLQSIYHREYLHDKAILFNDPEIWEEYKQLRNKINSVIKEAKQKFYAESVANTRSQKEMWKSLKHLIPLKKPDSFISPDLTAEDFSKYFIKIGVKLASQFEPATCPIRVHCEPSSAKFEFIPISVDFVRSQLILLEPESYLDVLHMDSKLIRLAADTICHAITYIINLSLQTGIIPTGWKMARVTPIFKDKGSRQNYSNYRPISVLSHFSKIFEKYVQTTYVSFEHYLLNIN